MTGPTTNRKMFHVKRGGKPLKIGSLSRCMQTWGASGKGLRSPRKDGPAPTGCGRRRGWARSAA